jgi:hypothetical protein
MPRNFRAFGAGRTCDKPPHLSPVDSADQLTPSFFCRLDDEVVY